jgi:hypothetical protein
MGNWRQISGVAGVLFVVTFVISAVMSGDTPTFADDGEEIAAWFSENSDTYLLSDFITGIAFIFFYFPFLNGLYNVLRAGEGEPAYWSRIALSGGLLFPIAGLAAGIFQVALALVEGQVSPEVASFAMAASYHGFAGVGALTAVLMGAASICILTTGVLWKWLGWLGVLLAIAAVIGSASTLEKDPEGPLGIFGIISFLGLGIWILAVSAGLLQRQERHL